MNHDLLTFRSASVLSMLIFTVAACKGNLPQNPTAPSAQSPAPPAAASVPSVTNWERLPVPAVAPSPNRQHAATVRVELETRAVKGLLADGVGYEFWTYNGTVPGPMIRVRVGDTVDLIVRNSLGSAVSHSIDSHAVTGPGGGGKVTQTPPGKTSEFRFKALNPGVFIYHCATPMIPYHIGHGMYGLMVVEPAQGWPKVDREFYVVQGDFYLSGDPKAEGLHDASVAKMQSETPDYVVFNGSVGSLNQARALRAKVGETVRIFFGVAGPNTTSSVHLIGEIFDRIYPEGASQPLSNVQSHLVPAGGAAMLEFGLEVPGSYILVDHSLSRLGKGAAAFLEVDGDANPAIFQTVTSGSPMTGGH